MFHSKLLEAHETAPFIEQFHIFGHGIQNGVSEEEHLRKLLAECAGLIGLLILKDNVPKAMATLLPEPTEDSHFTGTGIVCVHLAGSDLGVPGMRHVHKALRELAIANESSWYSISSRVSQFEYRNRYYMIGETP